MKHLAVVSIMLIGFVPALAQTAKNDTITFIGKCRYVGRTGSILATHYYNFEVVKVMKGEFIGNVISFEADANSTNELFLTSYQKGATVDLSADSLFNGHEYPIDQVHKCTSGIMEVKVVRSEVEVGFPEKVIVVYHKTWNSPRKKK